MMHYSSTSGFDSRAHFSENQTLFSISRCVRRIDTVPVELWAATVLLIIQVYSRCRRVSSLSWLLQMFSSIGYLVWLFHDTLSAKIAHSFKVWGPKPFGLGFIGAPIATAISFNLIALSSIIYGIFFTPATAWYPVSRRMFTGLGVLVNLGLSGVGTMRNFSWFTQLPDILWRK